MTVLTVSCNVLFRPPLDEFIIVPCDSNPAR